MLSTSSHKFHHLTREKRIKLEVLLRSDKSKSAIADILEVNRSTIYRELKRCNGPSSYDHSRAYQDYLNNRKNSCREQKSK